MEIPEISSYNPGTANPNMMEVEIPGLIRIFFSYKAPIAYAYRGRLFLNSEFYSATTSRHTAVLKRQFPRISTFDSGRDFKTSLERILNEVQQV